MCDGLALTAALAVAYPLRHGVPLSRAPHYVAALPYLIAVFLLALKLAGSYRARRGSFRELASIATGTGIGLSLALMSTFFYRDYEFSRLTALLFGALYIPAVALFRFGYRFALDLTLGNSRWKKRVIVVGSSRYIDALLAQMSEFQGEYSVVGRIWRNAEESEDSGPQTNGAAAVPALGALWEIDEILDRVKPDLVIAADPRLSDIEQYSVIKACYDRNVHWKLVPRLSTPLNLEIDVTVIAGIPLLGDRANNITGFNFVAKRAVDVALAVLLLLVFSPLMLAVAALIKIFSPGPVLFRQERIGHRGEAFTFYKFRSMHVANDDGIHRRFVKEWIANSENAKLEDKGTTVHKITKDPRIIPFIGAFIRKYSIDELPQILNVLAGDMSLVGPRPCLAYEVEYYLRWHKMRFDVLPGITGLWQVSGRNRLTFDEMVRLDIRYLQNWSLGLDLSIILRTPYAVLFDKAF